MRIKEQSGRVRIRNSPRLVLLTGTFLVLGSVPAFADSLWDHVKDVLILSDSSTGPIWHILSLVAVVVGSLLWGTVEVDSKRRLAGTVFGIGMALAAIYFMGPLF